MAWEAVTDEGKVKLIPLLGERTDLKEKERGTVRLSFSMGDPRSDYFATCRFVGIKFEKGE